MSNSPPFSVSIIVFSTYIAAFIIGGLGMAVFASFGFVGIPALALAAFIPVPLNGVVRHTLARTLASTVGASGQSPVAFSYLVRLLIGAVVAVLAAYGLSLAQLGFGFLAGGLAAALTAMVLSVIFSLAVSSRTAS